MEFFRNLDLLAERFRGGAVAVGNFDGVHRGHVRIAERLRAMARQVGGPAVVFTFDPPPSRILRPAAAPQPLCWTERKAEILAELGVDAVLAYPTDANFLRQDAREFFDRVLRGRLDARGLVEGRNFFFGRNRSGNVESLRRFCDETGLLLEVVEPVVVDGEVVSSSRVRELVAAGRIDQANQLLGRPYRARGTVVRGAGRGAGLGYPTANLERVDTLLPREGVYAGRALAGGAVWPAAIGLGPNLTFGERGLKFEAYLLDYRGSLYGQSVQVDFLVRLRDIERFDRVEELLAQMEQDVQRTRQIAKLQASDGL